MARTVIDLDSGATVLDAAERVGGVPSDHDVIVVAAAGSPFLRNAVFFDVARRAADSRRFAIVTSDQRARSLASSVHVPAYASVAALERHELDATERLDRARSAALARAPRRTERLRGPMLTRRVLGVAASLLAAVLVLAAVVAPEATVVVAPTTAAVGPLELEVRAGPNGDVGRRDLSAQVTAKVSGTATGAREELAKAKGVVRAENAKTDDIRIAKGTVFMTADGIRFQSTEDKTLPKSVIFFPIRLVEGSVDIPIEAINAGPPGNVAPGRISVSPRPNDYKVSNPAATTGGEIKRIPIVRREDYQAVAGKAAEAKIQEAAEAQLARWRSERRTDGFTVLARAYSKLTSVSPEAEVVGKEIETFEVTATGIATAFAVPTDEPTKTGLTRLRATVATDYTLDEATAKVDFRLQDDPSGTGNIVWQVTASGNALARVDRGRIQRVLAGRGVSEAAPQLERSGLRLERVTLSPSWWPRLPVLDARIEVRTVPASR